MTEENAKDFLSPVFCYRIKPEPREFWVNEYPEGAVWINRTKEDADAAKGDCRIHCFKVREVIE